MRTLGLIAALVLAATGATAAADGDVARAQFTTGIDDREPVDSISQIGTAHDRVTFFSELRDLEGHTVTHRWTHDGETQATINFNVGGPRWRVWSSKDLLVDWEGTWSVEVVDDAGRLHGTWSFVYGDPQEDEPAMDEAEPAAAPDADESMADDNGG